MNILTALIKRFFSRLKREDESPVDDTVTRQAKLGDMIAQYTLAFMYETGRGAQKNYMKAKKWYEKAAEQGHMGAKQKLNQLRKAPPRQKKEQGPPTSF